jgi:hypothetical protein
LIDAHIPERLKQRGPERFNKFLTEV